MGKFIEIISNEVFLDFLSTFGLAVVLVIYFVFVRDPKQAKFWRQRYDKLTDNYENLSKSYIRLDEDLRPESRMCSDEQAVRLAELGLDRDLYKLYYFMCEKLDDRRREDVGTFIAESIIDTNDAWSKFKSPFPSVPRIGDLYETYTKNGQSLKVELEKILQKDIPDEDKEKVKAKLWSFLFHNTVNMKGEFHGFIQNKNNGKGVIPYR